MMVWGFTGTREEKLITDAQRAWAYTELEDNRPAAVHHGACTGADALIHGICLELDIPVHVWPPINPKYLAVECLSPHPLVTVHPAMPYLSRDRQIVGAATVLKALPKQDKQPDPMHWGGTWYTVDFAQRCCQPVDICYPNGRVENRRDT
jgi:hypothetical protein